MKKILITGAAGFIGYHTAKNLLLNESYELILTDNLSRGKMDDDLKKLLENSSRIRFIEADLTDPSSYKNFPRDISYIYHFAALIGVRKVLQEPDKVLTVNALTVINLYEWALTLNQLERILFASTSEVYAGTLKHFAMPIPTPELTPLALLGVDDKRNSYSLSKMYGESLALMYAQVHGIPSTIVRYHNVYGPRMGFMHVVPELMCKFTTQDQVVIDSADHTRAFCYIDDAVESTILATTGPQGLNEIFNVGNSTEEIQILTLANKIRKIVGSSAQILPGHTTPGSPNRRCPLTEKIEAKIQVKPKVQLDEGLHRTFTWYKPYLDKPHE